MTERGRPKKYLTLLAFKEWCDNDFSHLIRRVNFTDLKLNFLLGFLALVLALLAILIVKII